LIASDIKLDSISQEFNIEKGVLQSFQHSATIMANQSAKFAEIVGFFVLAAAISRCKSRICFGISDNSIAMASLPSCNKQIAQVLSLEGIKTPVQIANSSKTTLSAILKKHSIWNPLNEHSITALHSEATEYINTWNIVEEIEDSFNQKLEKETRIP